MKKVILALAILGLTDLGANAQSMNTTPAAPVQQGTRGGSRTTIAPPSNRATNTRMSAPGAVGTGATRTDGTMYNGTTTPTNDGSMPGTNRNPASSTTNGVNPDGTLSNGSYGNGNTMTPGSTNGVYINPNGSGQNTNTGDGTNLNSTPTGTGTGTNGTTVTPGSTNSPR